MQIDLAGTGSPRAWRSIRLYDSVVARIMATRCHADTTALTAWTVSRLHFIAFTTQQRECPCAPICTQKRNTQNVMLFLCAFTHFRFASAVQRVVNFLGDADSTGVSGSLIACESAMWVGKIVSFETGHIFLFLRPLLDNWPAQYMVTRASRRTSWQPSRYNLLGERVYNCRVFCD